MGDAESLVTPIPLPTVNQSPFRAHSDANQNKSLIITPDKHIAVQRYVEVERLSTETNSVLISKSVDLQKVTEIIPVNLTHPFSTMVGTKLDSRSFGSIPVRSFDCKLKKVKVPNNYHPLLSNGFDKIDPTTIKGFMMEIGMEPLIKIYNGQIIPLGFSMTY